MTPHQEFRDDLPLYAVGALTKEESKQLEHHLAECPECRVELESFREAASQIAMAVETEAPPARLKTQLLARIEGRTEAESTLSQPRRSHSLSNQPLRRERPSGFATRLANREPGTPGSGFRRSPPPAWHSFLSGSGKKIALSSASFESKNI